MNPLGSRIGEISGQVVYLASGFNTVNAVVNADISGQVVRAEISGQTVVGNFAAQVSGNKIRLQGFDPSGNTWNDLIVNQSGGNVLRVDAGAISVSSNISGQVVYLTSGQNSVQISGQPISIIGTVPVSIAGTVTVAGTVSTNVSGNTIRNQWFDPSGGSWRDAWVDRSGGNKLQVTASGDTYSIGNTVTIQGTVNTSVSGNVITIGSQPIAVTTSISGNNVNVLMSGGSMSGLAVITQMSGGSMSGLAVTTSVSGNTVNIGNTPISVTLPTNPISGQTVISENSGQKIRIQAFDPSGNTWRDTWVERSGGNRLLVTNSGDSVTVSNTVTVQGTVTTSVSGNTVNIGNTPTVVTNISGQTVVAETSGNKIRAMAFDPSGQTWQDLWVSQSGGHDLRVNASVQATADISGQTVKAEVSGQKIRLQGFDPSGNTWNDLIVNQSGGNVLRVDAGSISVSSNISGQVVYLTSGQNNVQMSGQVVYLVGGNNIVRASFNRDIGASRDLITDGVSGSDRLLVSTSGQPIRSQAFDPSGAIWRDLWMERSGGNRLLVTNSGDSVQVSNTVAVTLPTNPISGQSINVTSGLVAIAGTVAASVSGSVVYPVSGISFNRAFDPSGSTWRDLWVERSGGNRLLVTNSGDSVTVSNTVTVQGTVQITVSGGSMSGLVTNSSGGAAVISGQPVRVSGEKIRLQGFDPSGNTWNDLIVNQSGGNVLRVDAGSISVASNVSGNVVYLTSGQNETLSLNRAFDPSGATWRDLWVERSGGNRLLVTNSGDSVQVSNTVTIQGAVTTSVSGNNVVVLMSGGSMSGLNVTTSGGAAVISGQPVNISGSIIHNQAFDPSGAVWRDLWFERSGGNRLLVTMSGDGITVGNTVTVQGTVQITVSGGSMSGLTVNQSGGAVVISGQIVHTSGDSALISGQPVKDQFWTAVRVPVTKQITAASGGAVLDSGIAQMVTIRNIGQSGTIMYVGYSGTNNAPFVSSERSGRGFQLKDGDSITIPVPQHSGNMDLIRVVSLTSGQEISYIAIGYNA